jgi:thymidylate synthase
MDNKHMRQLTFETASEAFDFYYGTIPYEGVDFAGTKAMFNQGFLIEKPWLRIIDNEKRKFNMPYAQAEWEWYLSGDPNIDKLGEIYGKIPQIWERMADADGEVNSNYGYQWKRSYQLDKVVHALRADSNTRQAAISIYDGKEINKYRYDTPCTYAVQFTVVNGKLNMCVVMRSNDLWFGFCNDQYCFSKLQELVSERTEYEVGTYYHFAHNLHLYYAQLPEHNPLTNRQRQYA